MKIRKPTEEDLQPLLEEATEEQTLAEYKTRYLSTVAKLVQKTPLHYRAYGPYWWVLKAAIVEAGLGVFEDPEVDRELVEAVVYPNLEHSLLAAWAYCELQHERGAQKDTSHMLELESGELFEYQLEDSELEQRGFFGR